MTYITLRPVPICKKNHEQRPRKGFSTSTNSTSSRLSSARAILKICNVKGYRKKPLLEPSPAGKMKVTFQSIQPTNV